MTSKTVTLPREDGRLDRFPDFPPREDMQNTKHLHLRSVLTTLLIHFADHERALVHGEVPVAPTLDPWDEWGYTGRRGLEIVSKVSHFLRLSA